jgi:winged helix-turn-helix protein
MLWVLNLSDGQHDLLDIVVRSGFTLDQISKAAEGLHEAGFLGRRENAVNKCGSSLFGVGTAQE